MNSLVVISRAEIMLQQATTPDETKQVESITAAARAWAKEQGDYEILVQATKIYIMSRRRTTELVLPEIKHGGNRQGNSQVTLSDYGFTKMQWHRRVRELQIEQEKIDEYFDECISKGWEPSLFDMTRKQLPSPVLVKHQDWCNTKLECNCGVTK